MRIGERFQRPASSLMCRVITTREPVYGIEVVFAVVELPDRGDGDYVIATLFDGQIQGTTTAGPYLGSMLNGFVEYVEKIERNPSKYLRYAAWSRSVRTVHVEVDQNA